METMFSKLSGLAAPVALRCERAVASHLALAACCRHEGIWFVGESLDMANAFGSLNRQKTEDVDSADAPRNRQFFLRCAGSATIHGSAGS